MQRDLSELINKRFWWRFTFQLFMESFNRVEFSHCFKPRGDSLEHDYLYINGKRCQWNNVFEVDYNYREPCTGCSGRQQEHLRRHGSGRSHYQSERSIRYDL